MERTNLQCSRVLEAAQALHISWTCESSLLAMLERLQSAISSSDCVREAPN